MELWVIICLMEMNKGTWVLDRGLSLVSKDKILQLWHLRVYVAAVMCASLPRVSCAASAMNSPEEAKTGCSHQAPVFSFLGSSFLLLWRPEGLCRAICCPHPQVPSTVGPRKELQEEAGFERRASLGKPKLAPKA